MIYIGFQNDMVLFATHNHGLAIKTIQSYKRDYYGKELGNNFHIREIEELEKKVRTK